MKIQPVPAGETPASTSRNPRKNKIPFGHCSTSWLFWRWTLISPLPEAWLET
jgi:hypothetical protein